MDTTGSIGTKHLAGWEVPKKNGNFEDHPFADSYCFKNERYKDAFTKMFAEWLRQNYFSTIKQKPTAVR